MAEQDIYTYNDAVDALIDSFGGSRDARTLRMAKSAVLASLRRLVGEVSWSYYVRRRKIVTAASQTTGTIAYDHTGGAAERLVTLTGATFPTNAYLYKIIIDSITYPIATYESSTTITLPADENPGADVTAGASYTLFRSQYPLPVNCRRIWPLVDLLRGFFPAQLQPNELLYNQAANWNPQEPLRYCIRNDGEYVGGKSIEFGPPPNVARTYDFLYLASARQLRTEKHSTGTITTDGTTTVAGDGGNAWTDAMVGCALRTSVDGTTEPTGLAGNLTADNPYLDQRIILKVNSATSLVVDSAIDALSSVKYTISDPIDIDTDPMLTCFQRLCEWQFAQAIRDESAVSHYQAYVEELRSAAKQENPRMVLLDSMSHEQYQYTLRDWAESSGFDSGTVV